MKTSLALALVIPLSLAFTYGHAQEGANLLKSKGCVACHAPDQKKVGPSLRDIAAKYKDAKDAQAGILAELKASKKHPKASASDAEMNSIVTYMLSAK